MPPRPQQARPTRTRKSPSDVILDPRLPERIQQLYVPCPITGCWLFWGKWDTGNGYGKVSWCGEHQVAHRLVYKLLVDPWLPDELLLDHKCRTRCCGNPAHLEPVSSKVNTMRGKAVLFRRLSA